MNSTGLDDGGRAVGTSRTLERRGNGPSPGASRRKQPCDAVSLAQEARPVSRPPARVEEGVVKAWSAAL